MRSDRANISAQMRDAVMERDFGMCRYCGRGAAVLDHVIPVARGGMTAMDNLVAACWTCNAAKHANTPAEVGFFLFTPIQARTLSWVRAQLMAESFEDLFGRVAGHEEIEKVAPKFLELMQAKVNWPSLRESDVFGPLRGLASAMPA